MPSWIANARLAGELSSRAAVGLEGGRIVALESQPPPGIAVLDARGAILVPAFSDAHVHLALAADSAAQARALLDGGVAAVLDLGAPERALLGFRGLEPLQVAFAGPLLTAPRGYPTQGWGADGYGIEIATEAEARGAVARVLALGARMVKLAFDARLPVLGRAVASAAVGEAHRLGLPVAAHALEAEMVREAVAAGVDVLAHAPSGTLPADLAKEIGARKLRVISTLHAYRGDGVENLRRLREAGAVVVYGTDLGNEGTAPGIDAEELSFLAAAGLGF